MRISHRPRISLEGIWGFKLDPEDVGETQGWHEGLVNTEDIYVPSSWNGQRSDWENYMGVAWYQRIFVIPEELKNKTPWLTFEGINYKAKVWLNGIFLGEHEGGFTSFILNMEKAIKYNDENLLVVKVDNKLTPKNIPPGEAMNKTYFDFFHYGGIQRPVYIEFTGKTYLEDITIITTHEGRLHIKVNIGGELKGKLIGRLLDPEGKEVRIFEHDITRREITFEERVNNVRPWSPEDPALYTLRLQLTSGGELSDWIDEYIGFRTVEVRDGKLLLNGRPICMKGLGRHEDFPITGKYLPGAVLIRDFNLMKSLGVNSFRTTHYPYSKLHLDLADRYGILVILEAPLVGLRDIHFKDREYLEKAKKVIAEMIKEHKNRPSVIMYSVANEPWSTTKEAREFIKELYDHAKKLDPTRPITFASMLHAKDAAIGVPDVISLNLYFGWYRNHGDIEAGVREAERIIEEVHKMYPRKPILITEFGAGAISGLHSEPPSMWSEEYQAEFIEKYLEMFKRKNFIIGYHIWCFADFKTPQSHFRTILNRKGIFTWIREPKLAARIVRKEFSRIPTFRE